MSKFVKGVILGSMVGASASIMMSSDIMNSRKRSKLIKKGKDIIKKSSDVIEDMTEMFK